MKRRPARKRRAIDSKKRHLSRNPREKQREDRWKRENYSAGGRRNRPLYKNENFTKDSTKVGNEKFYFNIKNAEEEHA